MLKCGSLICGSSNFRPEKKPLMLSMTDLTFSFAASMGVVMAVLMAFQTFVAVSLIPLKMSETVVFTDVNTVEILVFIPSTTFDTVVLMLFHVLTKNSLIPVQMFTKKVLMAVHASSHEEPNHPRTASRTPFMVSRMVERTERMPSHRFVKMFLTASHAPSQSP